MSALTYPFTKARQLGAALRKRLFPKALILMYHAVADWTPDPWLLAVTPEHFAAHLAVLKERAHPISLGKLLSLHAAGRVPERAVVLTFDDGYYNNLSHALPLLTGAAVPATMFITTGATTEGREFWWDALEQVLLAPVQLPPTLKLVLGQQIKTWHLGSAATYTEEDALADRGRAAWEAQEGSRLRLYHDVWAWLNPLAAHERYRLIETMAGWAGVTLRLREERRPCTEAELRRLSESRLIRLGAHTHSHSSLVGLTPDEQKREVGASKQVLEARLNADITLFSYPFGHYTPATLDLVKAAGFSAACTSRETSVWRGSSPFELPRVTVYDYSRATFEARLETWFKR